MNHRICHSRTHDRHDAERLAAQRRVDRFSEHFSALVRKTPAERALAISQAAPRTAAGAKRIKAKKAAEKARRRNRG